MTLVEILVTYALPLCLQLGNFRMCLRSKGIFVQEKKIYCSIFHEQKF